jgi:cold shock CspA family protein
MEIQWHAMDPIGEDARRKVEARIRQLVGKHGDLREVRINGQPSLHHRHGADAVHIVAHMRGGPPLIVTSTEGCIERALDDALDTFALQLRGRRERRRERPADAVPRPASLGIIDRVFPDEDYGFIVTDAGDQVYFHRNAVRGELEFGRLYEGKRVGLQFEAGEKGLQASSVVDVPPRVPAP